MSLAGFKSLCTISYLYIYITYTYMHSYTHMNTRSYGAASGGVGNCLQCDYGYFLSVLNDDCTGRCVPANVNGDAQVGSPKGATCTPKSGAECFKEVWCAYMPDCVCLSLCMVPFPGHSGMVTHLFMYIYTNIFMYDPDRRH
jgi:hypothetical protein